MKPYETWTDTEKINETIRLLCVISSNTDCITNVDFFSDFVLAFDMLATNKRIITINFPTEDTIKFIAVVKNNDEEDK
ncbi:gp158 [Bacillus phage W.Ph.]|uniref:Gp158 n=1 Tax=Bacillus phage W.Ph. TaxID=764595 RepID=G9B1Q9_9CAUD|nr:gp158 [Bacillus phage W.Ph.]ADH03304.1 gp158 [Bacillus phage W.Ph.]